MAFAQDGSRLSPYRKLLLDLSCELSTHDVEKLRFASLDVIPRGKMEGVASGFKLFDLLEQDGRITPQNMSLLEDMLKAIGRTDLAWKVQQFAKDDYDKIKSTGSTFEDVPDVAEGVKPCSPANASAVTQALQGEANSVDIDVVVPDGVGDELEMIPVSMPLSANQEAQVVGFACSTGPAAARLLRSAPNIATFSAGDGAQGSDNAPMAPVAAPRSYGNTGLSSGVGGLSPAIKNVATRQQAQASRLQHSQSDGLAPVRYVNFMAYEGYSVEIIGGKHFKTPDGEFVEMKSGTQYQIHVKNSRAYGCNLDISIDGYDIGGWVVDGGQELTIERPAYEAKKFTFYRVKTAPKEAGIESGRPENGVVTCVFTPEAFLDIPVIIPGLQQPLNVNIAPSASVGCLKGEVQRQLDISPDPDQVLALDNKVLQNPTPLSAVLESPGKLRLINAELDIRIEASMTEAFSVKIRPAKAKVIDVMKQIEANLDVPITDQKLYHEDSLLSEAPRRALPQKLICSLNPTVVVILPEYLEITVEDSISGSLSTVKIDKEKTLTDLKAELPTCTSLQENEEAVFYVNGRELSPEQDKGTLTSLGISSGSQVKVEVRVSFIQVCVTGLRQFFFRDIDMFQCHPSETFKDLLIRIKSKATIKKIDGATFSTKDRVFHPEQDLDTLQDYGIEHRSTLAFKVAEPQLSDNEVRDPEGHLQQEQAAKDLCIDKELGEEDYEFPAWNEPVQNTRVSGALRQYAGKRVALGMSEGGVFFGGSVSGTDIESKTVGSVLNTKDPAWRAGGTTLQGYSSQRFIPADPIKVDPSKKVELVVRLVAREDETNIEFPKDECTPLSTLYPPAVPE